MVRRVLFPALQSSGMSILLLGPRQTGKSTLIRALKPELEINLSDEETFVQFLRDPGHLKRVTGRAKSVFVDEVQRLPSLLNTAQVLIDRDKSVRWFFTGSSARKLKRGHANLLPGRVLSYELGPLSPQELGSKFDTIKALSLGLLPGIYFENQEATARKLLKSYSTTYLKEEIQAEALTRNLEGFSRFFHVVANRSGEFIDFSKFASHAMIERTTAKRYFDTLIDTLVMRAIDPFTKSRKTRLIQHPRFQIFDVGVLNGLLANFEPSPDRIGNLFEHLVVQTIESTAKSMDMECRLSTYRTEAGAEVDLILEIGKKVHAIEVKASRNIGISDLRGLKSFARFYGKAHRPMIVYLGESNQEWEGVSIRPLTAALAETFGYDQR